jgi:hypothetical protein
VGEKLEEQNKNGERCGSWRRCGKAKRFAAFPATCLEKYRTLFHSYHSDGGEIEARKA